MPPNIINLSWLIIMVLLHLIYSNSAMQGLITQAKQSKDHTLKAVIIVRHCGGNRQERQELQKLTYAKLFACTLTVL